MKLALGIEYNGKAYAGWQRQNHSLGVQEVVEKAVSVVANEPVNLFCAGRTDTGVHATGQVVHFETNTVRKTHSWWMGANANLPLDVSVL